MDTILNFYKCYSNDSPDEIIKGFAQKSHTNYKMRKPGLNLVFCCKKKKKLVSSHLYHNDCDI